MSEKTKNGQEIFEAEVIDSSVIDENIFKKVLLKAGRTLAKPA